MGKTLILSVCLLVAGAAQAEMLAGYDFDAGAADLSEATVVASNMTAGPLTSPMAISFVTTVGDDTGVDAAGGAFGSATNLGCVGIGVDDAVTSSFTNAVAGNDYVAFTITPDVGFELHLSGIMFKATKKHVNSVGEYAVTDADGNLIGSPVAITNVVGLTGAYDGVVVDLSGTGLENITRATEIRIYAWGRGTSNTSGTLAALDKITLHGSNIAGDYYVSPTGSDTNSGTLAEPFATIQHAVGQAVPGTTIFIREGTYREAVDLAGVAGSTNSPITLTAYPDETVTLDGTEAITNHWTLDAGSVYKTTVAEDVTQLFVDGELMTLARYPNAPVFSDSCWNGGRLAQDAGSSNGTVIDDALAETGVSYNDCVAIMNFGNHATGARLVENHVAGSNTFNYAALDKYKTQDQYFFEGGLNNAERVLLDTPEEWAYDESTRTLYLWADDGLDPNGRPVFAKGTNAYAIVGDADTHDIVIDGINFFATTFYLESSDRISIQNCDFDYYAASHRSLGDLEPPPTAFIDGDISNLCVDITIYNCAFRYADGGGLWVDNAENPRIENNLFQQIDYACVDPVDISDAEIFNLTKGTVPIRKSRDIVFRRNTVERAGSAQGVAISLYDTNEGRPCVLEYNYMTGCARRESDGAAFQIPVEHATHSTVRYNWFAGNHQRDLRYDGPSGGPLGNLYRNVALARNGKTIAAEGDGYACKGSGHEIYNNIGIYQECEIWTPGNAASTIRNNAADRMIPDPLSGTNSHNFAGQTAADNLTYLLRDPNNLDFRPRAGYTNLIDRGTNVTCDINGELVDVTAGYLGSAPDIGAYEFGDSAYWIPGRQEAQASMPVPRAGGQYVRTDADLMYLIGLGGESARVYFGTDPNELAFLTAKSDPENIVVLSDYAALDDNTTYYWRVDTVRADSSVVTGEVWSFTTMIDREFLPWSVRSIANADWVQDTAGSNIVYDNYDSLYSRRALVYSTHAYQSAGGFRLTVGYTAGSVDADLSHNFSFGLISTDTDLSTYAGENPFRVEPGVYSLGVHLISNGGGTMQGLNFADGSSVSNLDLSGDHVQFGTYEKYETMESNVVIIEIGPDGAWSYAINGITEASGVLTNGFDLSKSYRVAVYGQDDDGNGKAIQHMSLEQLPGPGSYTAWIAGYGLEGADAMGGADAENDGYDNFAEYALGMNPVNADAGSRDWKTIGSEGGTNWFEYVHYRRADYAELGLSYQLIESTNLVESVLATNTQDQVQVGAAVDGYEPVTNRYRTEDPQKFIQLQVWQE